MAKVDGPLFSFAASGTIASTVTFSKWKGRPYVRQRVIPSNPKSPLQISTRAMMTFLSQQWANISSAKQDSWQTIADEKVVSTFNAYTSTNMLLWSDFLSPREDAIPSSPTDATTFAATATGGVGEVVLGSTAVDYGTTWGAQFFRSTTMGFTPSRGNMIGIGPLNLASDDTPFVDKPLAAGTYYYVARPFSDTGQFTEQAFSAEVSAVVT